jgi:hypothetical protein
MPKETARLLNEILLRIRMIEAKQELLLKAVQELQTNSVLQSKNKTTKRSRL